MRTYLWEHRRWLPLIAYTFLALGLWANRVSLFYSHLPTLWGTALYDALFAALALLGFVCIFQEIRCPFMTRARVDRAFRQAGLRNGCGQYPVLVSVASDPHRNGKRYTVKNLGVSIPDMERKIDSLQRELGTIYEMSYSPKTTFTYLYIFPGKSIQPTIPPVTFDDEF